MRACWGSPTAPWSSTRLVSVGSVFLIIGNLVLTAGSPIYLPWQGVGKPCAALYY